MLVVQGLILQLEILKLFVLIGAIRLENISQIVHSLAYFLMQFMELGLGGLLEFLQLHLYFALLFSLIFKVLFEVIDGHLYIDWDRPRCHRLVI